MSIDPSNTTPAPMRVLLLGSGGREHALAKAIASSPLCKHLLCLPGSTGISTVATCLDGDPTDSAAVLQICQQEEVGFVVIGPEAPLVAGVADVLEDAGIPVFGCGQAGARLEGSKAYLKDFCVRAGIPTARAETFTETDKALGYVREHGAPIVIKADGLAAGKGVTVAMTEAEAEAAVRAALEDNAFGTAGACIVIEEFLDGEEISYFALVNGRSVFPLISAQDHKRAFDGDTGPNTGGMGAYAPAPACTPAIEAQILETILKPTTEALHTEGVPFVGVLFAGIMLVAESGEGEGSTRRIPKLLEYNVRFGDPECQSILPLLENDVLAMLYGLRHNTLSLQDIRWSGKTALTVVMAAKGYPHAPQKDTEIKGLDTLDALEGISLIHAGSRKVEEGGKRKWLANGGRVLNVTAVGADVQTAQTKAYEALSHIDWPEGFYRTDIGWRALKKP